MKGHEAAVAAFFKECEKERPVETARVFRRHMVLNDEQLKYRAERELFAFGVGTDGDLDLEFDPDTRKVWEVGETTDLGAVASLVRHREVVELRELAARRGEPYGGV